MVEVKNAGDPEQVAKAKEREKRGRELELSDLAFILADVRGRRFYWRKLEGCGIFKLSFTGVSAHTDFNEGQRNIGLLMLNDLMEANPEALIIMMRENNNEQESKKEK